MKIKNMKMGNQRKFEFSNAKLGFVYNLLVIRYVIPKSQAARSQVCAGWQIIEVNGIVPKNDKHVEKIINRCRKKKTISIFITFQTSNSVVIIAALNAIEQSISYIEPLINNDTAFRIATAAATAAFTATANAIA